ncbi:MAG: hypothetical protein ACRDM7_16370 [Thermoleophilaceae bacterium]
MTTIRRFQPTPAFVLAIIALVVAMSGTAVAVTAIAPNSVKSKHIVNGHVKTNDLAADSVRGPKVQDASLTGADVQNGSLTGEDVTDDSLTGADVNEATLQGLMASRVRMVISQSPAVQFGAERVATCAANEKAIGGGAAWLLPGTNSPTQLEAPVTASMPEPAIPAADGATGWRGAGRNLSGVNRVLRVYAVCVPKQP